MTHEPYGNLGLRHTAWDREQHERYFVVSVSGTFRRILRVSRDELYVIYEYPGHRWLVIGKRIGSDLEDLLGLCTTRTKALNMAKLLMLEAALA